MDFEALKIPWALSRTRELLRPTVVDRVRDGPFTCFECGGSVHLRREHTRHGPTKNTVSDQPCPDTPPDIVRIQAHFSHAHAARDTKISCRGGSGESDTHKIAKLLLQSHVKRMCEDHRTLMWSCVEPVTCDGAVCGALSPVLLCEEAVEHCEVEQWLDDVRLRPDVLLLTHSGARIALEVFFTHAVSSEKAAVFAAADIACLEFEALHLLKDFMSDAPLRAKKLTGVSCPKCAARREVERAEQYEAAHIKIDEDIKAALKAALEAEEDARVVQEARDAKQRQDVLAAAQQQLQATEVARLAEENARVLCASLALRDAEHALRRQQELELWEMRRKDEALRAFSAKMCAGRCFATRPHGCSLCVLEECKTCSARHPQHVLERNRKREGRLTQGYCSDACATTFVVRVAFEFKDRAKALGARWNADRRVWYAANETDVERLKSGGFHRII